MQISAVLEDKTHSSLLFVEILTHEHLNLLLSQHFEMGLSESCFKGPLEFPQTTENHLH